MYCFAIPVGVFFFSLVVVYFLTSVLVNNL